MDNMSGAIARAEQPEMQAEARGFGNSGIALGFAIGSSRILQRGPIIVMSLGIALSVTGAIIERSLTIAGATDRTLAGTFRLLIPLVAFAFAGQATARSRLRDAIWPIARHGVSRRAGAFGLSLAVIVASMIVSAVLALTSVLSAYSAAAPPLFSDTFQCAWIGAITGAAYAAWFCFGATFFSRGKGRWVPLVASLLVGESTGTLGAILPHAHARSLLGGDGPISLGQRGSSAILVGMAIFLCLAASWRSSE